MRSAKNSWGKNKNAERNSAWTTANNPSHIPHSFKKLTCNETKFIALITLGLDLITDSLAKAQTYIFPRGLQLQGVHWRGEIKTHWAKRSRCLCEERLCPVVVARLKVTHFNHCLNMFLIIWRFWLERGPYCLPACVPRESLSYEKRSINKMTTKSNEINKPKIPEA